MTDFFIFSAATGVFPAGFRRLADFYLTHSLPRTLYSVEGV